MTKKHMQIAAAHIKMNLGSGSDWAQYFAFAGLFAACNPRFNETQFREACGLPFDAPGWTRTIPKLTTDGVTMKEYMDANGRIL